MFKIVVKNTNTKEALFSLQRSTIKSAHRMKRGIKRHYKERKEIEVEIVQDN
jgi:hypothetical protein